MSIVAQDVFADRIERYIERNPDTSAPEVLGRFLAEPTDEQLELVESILTGGVGGSETPQTSGESGGAGGFA